MAARLPPQHVQDDSDDYEDDSEEDYLYERPPKEPLRYTNDCPSLPVDKPVGYPHIIRSDPGFNEDTDDRDLTAADGIATFLWKWKPEEFRKFFDFSKERYEVSRVVAGGVVCADMLIARVGRGVMAGYRIDDNYGGKEWDPQISFTIEEDGKWTPRSCHQGSRPDIVMYWGMAFARAILYHKLWKEDERTVFKTYE